MTSKLASSDVERLRVAIRSGTIDQVGDIPQILAGQLKRSRAKPAIHEAEHLLGLSLLSEYSYLRGDFKEAEEWVAGAAATIRRALGSQHGAKIARHHGLLKQQMWVLAAYAIALFRQGTATNRREAAVVLDRALAFVEEKLLREDDMCFGTRARLLYYRGLVARNDGDIRRARECFGQAWEMTILRRDASHDGARSAPPGDREFTTRCLARVQAFGVGLLHFCEGQLWLAGLAFQTAVELLDALPGSSGGKRLMRAQVRTHLGLVQALLADLRPIGEGSLRRVSGQLKEDYEILASLSANKDADPYLRLAKATQRFVDSRLRCIARDRGETVADPEPLDLTQTVTTHVGDLIEETAALLDVWCGLERDDLDSLQRAQGLCHRLESHVSSLAFLRVEIKLSSVEAYVRMARVMSEQSTKPDDKSAQEAGNYRELARANLKRVFREPRLTEVQGRLLRLLTCEQLLADGERASALVLWARTAPSQKTPRNYYGWRVKQLAKRYDLPDVPDVPEELPLPYTDPTFTPKAASRLNEVIVGYNMICQASRRHVSNGSIANARQLRGEIAALGIDLSEYRSLFPQYLWWLNDVPLKSGDPKDLETKADIVKYIAHVDKRRVRGYDAP